MDAAQKGKQILKHKRCKYILPPLETSHISTLVFLLKHTTDMIMLAGFSFLMDVSATPSRTARLTSVDAELTRNSRHAYSEVLKSLKTGCNFCIFLF